MAIESSGAISLGSAAGTNRSIAGEFGGSTPHSLSEYYRDGNYSDGINIPSGETDIPASGAISFSDFYGTAAATFTWGSIIAIPQQWGDITGNQESFGSAFASCQLGFAHQPTLNRIRVRFSNSSNTQGTSFSYVNMTYSGGLTPTSIQVQLNWSGSFSGSSGSGTGGSEPSDGTSGGNSFTWTSGTYHTIAEQSTPSDSGTFSNAVWSVTVSSANQLRRYRAGVSSGTGMTMRFKAIGISGTPDEGPSSENTMDLIASKEGQSGGGLP
mgnify:FL=1|tara:strand:+ start:323 stop:1129 length:807 start_codon:yes stop_codon:yes gene_type:complete